MADVFGWAEVFCAAQDWKSGAFGQKWPYK
jgi:hypothetical protein